MPKPLCILTLKILISVLLFAQSVDDYKVIDSVIHEDFSEVLQLPFELYESTYGRAYIESGKLVVEAFTDSGISRYVKVNIPSDPDELFMEARIKIPYAGIAGLLFNFESWQNYGWVLLSTDGKLTAGFVENGKTRYLVRDIPLFNFSPRGWNTVRISQRRHSLKIFVNGYVEVTEHPLPVKGQGYGFIVAGHSKIIVDELKLGYKVVLKKEGDVYVRAFGSGVILDSFHVLTAYHVVEDATNIFVTLINDGKEDTTLKASVLYYDKKTDVAILKVETPLKLKFPVPYSIRRTGTLPLGSYVFTLGYPLIHAGMGTSIKFQDGRISSKVGYEGDPSQYQTTIPAAPGFSGAPVFDESGYLVGILTAKHELAENASYAVKSTAFLSLIDLLEDVHILDKPLITGSIEEVVKILAPYIVIVKVQ